MAGQQDQSNLVPHLALIGAAALWGGSFLATKVGMADAGPFALVALRFAAEAVPRPTPSLVWIVIGFGAASAYIQAAMSWGQRHVDSSRAAVIYSLEPVFGGLIGFAAREVLGASDVVGGAIIVVGVVVASLPGLVLRRPAALLRIRCRRRELVGADGVSA